MATQGTVVLTSGTITGHHYIDATGNNTHYAMSIQSGAWPTTVYKIISVTLTCTLRDAANKYSLVTVLANGASVGMFGVNGTNGQHTVPGLSTSANWAGLTELRLTGASPYAQIAGGSAVLLTIVWELDDVPSTFALSAASVLARGSVTATISPYRTSYGHRITYAFGGASSSYTLAAGVTSHTFTVPPEWLYQIPNTQTGTGTVTLTTLDGTRAIGTATAPLTVGVPSDVVPTFNAAVAPLLTVGGVTYPSMGSGVYVQGRSGFRATISSAAGLYGATIASYTIRGAGYSGSAATLDSGLINTSGNVVITFTVTDSRGMSTTKTITITVLAYAVPTVTAFSGWRVNSAGTADPSGTLGYVRAVWSFSNPNNQNTCSAVCYLTPSGGTEQRLNAAMVSGTSYPVRNTSGANITLPVITNYTLRLVLTDKYGAVSFYAELPSANFAMHLSADGSSIAFGKACERRNAVEVASGRTVYVGDNQVLHQGNTNLLQSWLTGNMSTILTWLTNNGGYYNLVYRGGAVNMDTTCQYAGVWLTSQNTLGTWPASIPNRYGILISYTTANTLDSGYRMQELHSIVEPATVWKRHRWDDGAWTAWHKFSGLIDA